MNATEFVPLSEERLWEIVDEYDKAITNDDPRRLRFGLAAMAILVSAEASENTKRWLMEKVCAECGGPDHFLSGGWCRRGRESGYLTRAEYLSRTEPR